LSSCPNLAGLKPFDAKARAAIAATFATLKQDGGNFFDDLKVADRSWWLGLFEAWQEIIPPLGGVSPIDSIAPASSDALAPMISKACGNQLVNDSLVVTFTPKNYFPDSHFFVLDRGGRPLVYFQGS
jgi:hypothetical protein